MRMLRLFLGMLVVGSCAGSVVAAPDVEIKGVVTDNAGKPIRGARVTATTGIKSISRYSQKDGSYDIAVAGGTYSVSAEAFGFAPRRQEKQTEQKGDVNFNSATGGRESSYRRGDRKHPARECRDAANFGRMHFLPQPRAPHPETGQHCGRVARLPSHNDARKVSSDGGSADQSWL